MSRVIDNNNEYANKLVKLIPTEIIAAYLAIEGILKSQLEIRHIALIVVTLFLFCLVPLYLYYLSNVRNRAQVIVTMFSFVVWVFSLGGIFEYYNWYYPVYGSIVLILWTTTVPLFKYD